MSKPLLSPYSLSWPKGKLVKKKIETGSHQIEFFTMQIVDDISFDGLPTEFFNHQILDINAENIGEIKSFSEEWGLLYSPLRNLNKDAIDYLFYLSAIDPHAQIKHSKEMVSTSYRAIYDTEQCINEIKEEYLSKNSPFRNKYNPIVSTEELKHSIELTQEIIRFFMGYSSVSSFEFGLYSEIISSCSCNSHCLPSPVDELGGPILKNRGLLISAIFNQMLETFSSNDPWKKCANEKCYKYFKQKQTNAISGNTRSKYCCKKCEYQQSKRNQRKAARNRNNPTR